MVHFSSLRQISLFFSVFLMCNLLTVQAQVGIGTTEPDPNAALDVFSANQGILIPRVALTSLTVNTPLTSPVTAGTLVYNTATAGSGANAVSPGFYSHNGQTSGIRWVRFASTSDPKVGWELTGNAGTDPVNNFLGTTDDQAFNIRTNNAERMRIDSNGQILINTTTTALNTAAFESRMTGSFSTGILGIGVGGTTAIRAENQGNDGDALWARNTTADGEGNAFGIWATSNQVGGATIVSGLRSNGYFRNAVISTVSEVTGGDTPSYGIIAQSRSAIAQSAAVKGQTSGSPSGGVFLNSWRNDDAVGATGQYIGGGNIDGIGLVGISNAQNTFLRRYGVGVLGQGNYYGVFANGDLGASGVKNFLIDYPLDPENKLLQHSSIESSEVLNLYRGSSTFDNEGIAKVELPEYFEAININYTYQLTAVGAPMPDLYISQEIKNNKFEIAGGVMDKKVNWVVYGERNDPYLQKYPEKRKVVLDKKNHEKGKYYMPELYGQPEEKGVFHKYKRSMTEMKIKESTDDNLSVNNYSENNLNSSSIQESSTNGNEQQISENSAPSQSQNSNKLNTKN